MGVILRTYIKDVLKDVTARGGQIIKIYLSLSRIFMVRVELKSDGGLCIEKKTDIGLYSG